jgi:hypothetical protein
LSQKGKKGETTPTFLDGDLDFTDTILMGLNSIDADLNRPVDVTNPFDFDMQWFTSVESFSIENTNSLETVLYKTSTKIVGLQNSSELSSLNTADLYGTTSTVDSTGNAPKTLVHNLHTTLLQMKFILI